MARIDTRDEKALKDFAQAASVTVPEICEAIEPVGPDEPYARAHLQKVNFESERLNSHPPAPGEGSDLPAPFQSEC